MTNETQMKPITKKSAVRDYLKCVWSNKATLAGYLLLPIAVGLNVLGRQEECKFLNNLSYISGHIGACLLAATSLGRDTLETYRKARDYMLYFGKVKDEYKNLKDKYYCSRVGIRLAAQEAGLEDSLRE